MIDFENASYYQQQDRSNLKNSKFNANLAEKMSDNALEHLASDLIDAIESDIKAQEPWLNLHEDLKRFLGDYCDDLKQANNLSQVVDGTLGTALIKFVATAKAELLPDNGPAGFKIFSRNPQNLEHIAYIRSSWLNYYLTVKDSHFYTDFEKFLYYLGFYGTVVRKVYYDEMLGMPVSRFIAPQYFVFNIDCTSIEESDRLTHIVQMSEREIIEKRKSGIFLDVELPYIDEADANYVDITDVTVDNELINLNVYKRNSLHHIYETRVYLDLNDYTKDRHRQKKRNSRRNLLPYLISIDKNTRKILRIEQNWRDDDPRKERINDLIIYQYFTGLDIFGQGIARMSAHNIVAATKLLRQTIDAATFQSHPCGFFTGLGDLNKQTDFNLSPGRWIPVNSISGADLRSSFVPLPAPGPSQEIVSLRNDMIAQLQERLSATELGMFQSKEDIATGTAVAFLEEKNRIQSTILKSIHKSLAQELKLLDEMFANIINEEEFYTNNERSIITADDFIDGVKIVPVCDPSINSTVQKIMKAEAIAQTAKQFPGIIDEVKILTMILKAQNVSDEEINAIIKIPEPVPQQEPNILDPNQIKMAEIQKDLADIEQRDKSAMIKREDNMLQHDIAEKKLALEAQKLELKAAELSQKDAVEKDKITTSMFGHQLNFEKSMLSPNIENLINKILKNK